MIFKRALNVENDQKYVIISCQWSEHARILNWIRQFPETSPTPTFLKSRKGNFMLFKYNVCISYVAPPILHTSSANKVISRYPVLEIRILTFVFYCSYLSNRGSKYSVCFMSVLNCTKLLLESKNKWTRYNPWTL